MNRVFKSFFRAFEAWMKESGGNSQRKLGEPAPSFGLLETSMNECQGKLSDLQVESHRWKNAKTDGIGVDIRRMADVPNDPCNAISIVDLDRHLGKLSSACDRLSLTVQRRCAPCAEIENIGRQIDQELHETLEIDYRKQMQISSRLREIYGSTFRESPHLHLIHSDS
jgi:hypothetical protein